MLCTYILRDSRFRSCVIKVLAYSCGLLPSILLPGMATAQVTALHFPTPYAPIFTGQVREPAIKTVQIQRVQPHSLVLADGQQQTIVTLYGSSLAAITSAQLVLGSQPVPDARLRLGPAGDRSRRIVIQLARVTRPGTGYQIRVRAGQRQMMLPIRIRIRAAESHTPVNDTGLASSLPRFQTPVSVRRVQPERKLLRFRRPFTHGEQVLNNRRIQVLSAQPGSIQLVAGGASQQLVLTGKHLDEITGVRFVPATKSLVVIIKTASKTRLLLTLQAGMVDHEGMVYQLQLKAGTSSIYTSVSLRIQNSGQTVPGNKPAVAIKQFQVQPVVVFSGDSVSATLFLTRVPDYPVTVHLTSSNPLVSIDPPSRAMREQTATFAVYTMKAKVETKVLITAVIPGQQPTRTALLKLMPLPEIVDFTGNGQHSPVVIPGESLQLRWQTRNASSVRIERDGNIIADHLQATGRIQVRPQVATQYHLIAGTAQKRFSGSVNDVESSFDVKMMEPAVLQDITLSSATAFPHENIKGTVSLTHASSSLSPTVVELSSSNQAAVPYRPMITLLDAVGSFTLHTAIVHMTTEVTITATIPKRNSIVNTLLKVLPLPEIVRFTGDDGHGHNRHGKNIFHVNAFRGEPLMLSWVTASARLVRIEEAGKVIADQQPPSGTLTVTPQEDTRYVLVAVGAQQRVVSSALSVTARSPRLSLKADLYNIQAGRGTGLYPVLYGWDRRDLISSRAEDFLLKIEQTGNNMGTLQFVQDHWFYRAPTTVKDQRQVFIIATLRRESHISTGLRLRLYRGR